MISSNSTNFKMKQDLNWKKAISMFYAKDTVSDNGQNTHSNVSSPDKKLIWKIYWEAVRVSANLQTHSPGEWGTSYNAMCGQAPPERGTFFRLQVHERVGISRIEVYERVGRSIIAVCKKAQKEFQMYFIALKKLGKFPSFVIYSYFKDSALLAVKRDAKF